MECIVCGEILKKNRNKKSHIRTSKHLKITNDLWDDIEDLKDLIIEETDEIKKKELNEKIKEITEKRELYMNYSSMIFKNNY